MEAFASGEARHCVNLEPSRLGASTLSIRHLDRVGVLAQVLDRLSTAHLNVEHMQNRIFRGGDAAVATIDVVGDVTEPLLEDLRGVPHVLGVTQVTALVRVIRPFPALVVRPDWARRLVTGLAELPEDTGTLPPVAPPDPAAYVLLEPSLFVYRQDEHVGIVCEVAVRSFVDGQVRGHEAVQKQRVESLVRHVETTDAPPALVALLHHAGPVYARLVNEVQAGPPLLDFDGPGRRRQSVWQVPEGAALDALVAELSSAEHYVADGHHRVAAALESWRGSGEPDGSGVLCVLHPMDGLRLSAFHRRVTGPVDVASLLDLLRSEFDVAERGGAHTDCGRLRPVRRWPLARRGDPRSRSDLDVEVLQSQVLDRLAQRVEIAPAKTEVDELRRRCDMDGGVLFTLAPPPLSALTMLADSGGVMPPKTTYFEPKPCAGIFRLPHPRTSA